MAVLKTTSPAADLGAPKECPLNTIPFSSISEASGLSIVAIRLADKAIKIE
jgi:hypothetical protein